MDFDFILSCTRAVPTRYVPQHWGNMRLMPGCKTFEDERGGERLAEVMARHRQRIPLLRRPAIHLTKARIDLHRLRRAWGLL